MIPAQQPTPRGLSRLSAWLSSQAPPAAVEVKHVEAERRPPGHGTTAGRLYAEIGEFLFTHGLPLSPELFGVALAYVGGDDRALTVAIQDRLRIHGSLDADFLRQLAEGRSGSGIRPSTIARMADGMATQLAQCLALLGQSCSSAEAYGTALGAEAERLAARDDHAVSRLIELTVQAVSTSRHMAEQLEETRRETERLRDNLDRARRAAEQDHLTGLVNRRGFDQRLQARLKAHEGEPWCVALCDIDDFKRINDRHGHDAGDRVLKLVARVLKTELSPHATVARHGGEEFACLFAASDADAAFALLDDVRQSLAERSLVNQETGAPIGTLTMSIGLAAVAADPAAAMREADAALYAAKRSGKNRVVASTRAATRCD